MSEQLQFKISSALKNIIGRDLINDDFIAVFELVKNSYDAHASRVDIYFEDIYSNNAKIIIQDNGKGMSYEDLIDKWLFVAYSAKKEGTEEDSYDYRDNIKIKRAYAGAKGIGRFSCDRLGGNLYLETKKDELNPKTEILFTDWDKFDGDLKDEFVNVSVLHDTLLANAVEYSCGTRLEISRLHSFWDRTKFLKLKDDLAKLINPNKDRHEDSFKIFIHVDEELENDSKQKEYRKIVNGEIKNLVFETLDLKTTRISSFVNNTEIVTELYEGGRLIYRISETNELSDLKDIDIVIYFLNRSAKYSFTKKMGMHAIAYGHIFMYKNGLRIYPYGERGEDPLKMDNRKAQGYNRYLGTREVIGYIEINGKNELLTETSSRGDGIQKTKAYYDLVEWFYIVLRRLERYSKNITDWGNDLSPNNYINFSNEEKVDALRNLIQNLTQSNSIISYELAPEILEILNNKQKDSAPAIFQSIREDIDSDIFDKNEIIKKISNAENKFFELKQIKEEAEEEAFDKLLKNENLEKKLELEQDKNTYLRATRKTLSEDADELIHSMKLSAIGIEESIDKVLEEHKDDISRNKVLFAELIGIREIAERVKKLSMLITKSNFKTDEEEQKVNVSKFIKEYLENYSYAYKGKIDITCKGDSDFFTRLSILDLTIIIDNLISNSFKAKATKIEIQFIDNEFELEMLFTDNGNGLDLSSFPDVESIFELGVKSKTEGSGIGLYSVRKKLQNMYGDIKFIGNKITLKGATFKLIFK